MLENYKFILTDKEYNDDDRNHRKNYTKAHYNYSSIKKQYS